MAYKRTVWENGVTPINAANLNNMEDGIVEAKTEVRPFKTGGTNADTAAAARQNINFIGTNPIASAEDDTVDNWVALGTGFASFGTAGLLIDQPSQHGVVLNIVTGNSLKQMWFVLATGNIYHRGGNQNGWSGTWRKMLDETNGVQRKKVWENTSPASEFKKQDINVSLSEGDEIEIEYRPYNGSTATKRERCRVGDTMVLDLVSSNNAFSSGSVIMAGFRRVSTTETTVAVNTGYAYNGEDNRFCVPIRVYVIKGVQ